MAVLVLKTDGVYRRESCVYPWRGAELGAGLVWETLAV